jgi:amino acid adenylation domain-containing protein
VNFLLHHLLTNAARRFGDRVAIQSGNSELTYKQLDELSDKLATTLVEQGVVRGERIAIYADKSPFALAGLYAVLKAGCAYVPLDPAAPTERLSYIVRDCGVRTVLISKAKFRQLTEVFPSDNHAEIVVVIDGDPATKKLNGTRVIGLSHFEHTQALPLRAGIETDLAYILYTSGSTGQPKGVMISHLNSLTFVRWAVEVTGIESTDRLSSHAPWHFDLSIFDLYGAATVGATVLAVPAGTSTFPLLMADWISEQQISVWYSVPSALSMMARQGKIDRHQFKHLRTMIFAGEVFPVRYLRAWMKHVDHARFLNWYGPTETNVITAYEVTQIPESDAAPVPIGAACENTRTFMIDESGKRLSKPGTEGELVATGSCVARGYWGDAKKTRSVFVDDDSRPWTGEKTYRTGDIVTIDDKRNYIYVGRRDHMVKSRGYRIELGEIESVLYRHPDVRETAVVAVPDEIIGNKIRAFVVVAESSNLTSALLENEIAKALPRYMIPERLDIVENLPKTSTGKINRPELVAAGVATV